MHNIFICHHHDNDQYYKDKLIQLNELYNIFIDGSVDTGDISDDLDDEAIREKIRDEYLKDTSVTIVLVGLETKKRKHIDWEIYSSMFDGKVTQKANINASLFMLSTVHEEFRSNLQFITEEYKKKVLIKSTLDWLNEIAKNYLRKQFPLIKDFIK